MNSILYQWDRPPIRTESKNKKKFKKKIFACSAFRLIGLACGAFLLIKYLFLHHSGMYLIWSFLFCLPIPWGSYTTPRRLDKFWKRAQFVTVFLTGLKTCVFFGASSTRVFWAGLKSISISSRGLLYLICFSGAQMVYFLKVVLVWFMIV
jgi:hypothetical protein